MQKNNYLWTAFLIILCSSLALGATDGKKEKGGFFFQKKSPKKQVEKKKLDKKEEEKKKELEAQTQAVRDVSLTQDVNRILKINESLKVDYQRQAGEILKINQQVQATDKILKTSRTAVPQTYKVVDSSELLRQNELRRTQENIARSQQIAKATE